MAARWRDAGARGGVHRRRRLSVRRAWSDVWLHGSGSCGRDSYGGRDSYADRSGRSPTPTPTRADGPAAESTPATAPPAAAPAAARVITDGLNVRAEPGLAYPVVGQLPNGAEIDVVSRDHEGAWLAIPGTGYVFYKAAWIELDRDVSDVPKRTRDLGHVIGPLHGAGTRTGVPAVDAVVEAVTDGDLDRLSELLVFEEMPCTLGQEFYLDPPLCPAGEPAGTPVAVMPFSANHPGWLRELDRERIVGSLLLGAAGAELTPPRLYGVARAANQRWYTYAAIFAFEPSGVGYFLGSRSAASSGSAMENLRSPRLSSPA